jgi:hypothetical protein
MKKQLLFVFALLTCGAMSAQVYLTQDFNGSGTALPAGWSFTVADNAADESDGWRRGTATNLSSTSWGYPDNGTKILSTNDDDCDCDKSADRLLFPATDLTTALVPYLIYDQYYQAGTYQGATEVSYIEVSTDGGTTWEELAEVAPNSIGDWQTVAYSLADYAGMSNVIVSVLYNDDGGWLFGFGIDNASISEQPQGFNVAVTDFIAAPMLEAVPTIYPAATVVAGRDMYFAITVYNSLATELVSFDATISNGVDEITESFDGVNLGWLNSAQIIFNGTLPAAEGNNDYTVMLSNINGGVDDDGTDNVGEFGGINGVTLHPDKGVLIEEATGTWCGWCVRGTVLMESMYETFPDNFIGIAVHNADPMVLDAYDTWIGTQINGYPSIIADRDGSVYDPLDMQNLIAEKASEAPAATLSTTSTLVGNNLTINVSALYNENLSGDYRFAVILTEDQMSGTAADWDQTNYYAGGGYGPMGGFEDEAGTVEGLMYNHVGRALIGGTDGQSGSLPASGTMGSTYDYSFNYTLDNTMNANYIKPVAVMLNANSGEVVNAKMSEVTVSVPESLTLDNTLIVYPNPSNGIINLLSNMPNAGQANVRVYASTGELVLNKQINNMNSRNILDVQEFGSGLYTVVVDAAGFTASRRVTVSK